MEVIHTYQANLATSLNEPVLHAMQYDGARKITVQLYSGHAVWAVPEGVTAGIGYTLPNRQSEYYEELSDGTAACTVEGNTVTAVLAPSLTSVVGEVKASIIFAKDGIQLSTFPFRIRVTARPGEVDSATRPDVASPFVGKLYYGGDDGLAVPLKLGSGVWVEQQPDGSLMLIAESNGSGGGTSSAVVSQMISLHNVERYAHEDIRRELRALADRFNALANSDDIDLDQMAEVVAYIRSNKALIDAITTSKVSVADIVNNLVTNVSNKPLSAAMGVALAGEIDSMRASKLDASKLTASINTALAEAQKSGAFDGADGRGITSITRTSGNGAAGTVDTYTINYTDNTQSTYQVRNGENGKDGVGISEAEINENGELVITYSNDETINLGRVVGEGSGGAGIPGKDGVGISKTEINGEGHLVITYTDGKTVDLGNVIGAPGADGIAATVAIVGATAIPAGSSPSVTEAGGSTAQNRRYLLGIPRGEQGPAGADGKDGADGADGQPGKDGISPVVAVSTITGGNRITITDKNGTNTVDVMHGKNGSDGKDGADGSPGKDGATGPQGPKGDTGETGQQGPKGDAGDSGVHILADGETLDDVPPSASVVIDPRGDGFGTQVFTFTLTDGSVVEMEVVARVI